MDYIFCVRKIRKGEFTNEPGDVTWLKIPAGDHDVTPAHKVSRTEFVADVQKIALHGAQDEGPKGDILIYVHGFNTPQSVMLERHRLIRKSLEKLGYEGVVVSFDWPCADKAINYLEDRKDAKATAIKLVDEGIANFAKLQKPNCWINVHLLAHSMGTYVVREAFDDADDRMSIASKSWSVSQVMLFGGDISAGSLEDGNSKSSSLYRHCVRLTNYFNPFDDILTLSNVKRVGVSPRVGRVGLPTHRPSKAVNVNCGNYFDANRGKFKRVQNAGHCWYYYDEAFMKDVLQTINGDVDRNSIAGRVMGSEGNLVLVA